MRFLSCSFKARFIEYHIIYHIIYHITYRIICKKSDMTTSIKDGDSIRRAWSFISYHIISYITSYVWYMMWYTIICMYCVTRNTARITLLGRNVQDLNHSVSYHIMYHIVYRIIFHIMYHILCMIYNVTHKCMYCITSNTPSFTLWKLKLRNFVLSF